MTVKLYSFTKRKNSTKQPGANTGTTLSCQLKNDCSVMNPVLIFNPNSADFSTPFNPSQYNYVYIPTFSRYYFVSDWSYARGVWECSIAVDVLASFKTAIGATSSYIIRSASASDGSVIDGKYPAKTETTIQRIALASSWNGVAPSGGCYVVGIINNVAAGNIGSVCYYVLTTSQLGSLLTWMFSDSIFNASSIDEIGSGLYKSIFNPFQYIVSAMWFPFGLASIASSNTANIVVGYWNSGISAQVIGSLAQLTFVTGSIPDHPQIARGSYLNYAPYTVLTMYIEPFGSIPIDTSFRNIGNYLYCPVYIDHITGECLLRVAITESSSVLNQSRIITERTAKIGVPIQIAQTATDYIGMISGGLQAIGSLASLNPIGIAGGVLNALESSMPKVSTQGVNGSFSMTIPDPSLICEFKHLVNENQTEYGRPLMDTRTINTLVGFIQCGESDHAFSSLSGENDQINQYLISGFFYE